jgi:hypothetical protein
MLYYERVSFILDGRVFSSLWRQLGRDGVESLLNHPTLRVEITPEMPAIYNHTDNYVRTHKPIYMSLAGDKAHSIKARDTARILHHMVSRDLEVSLDEVKQVIKNLSDTRYSKILNQEISADSLFESLIRDSDSMKLFVKRYVERNGNGVDNDKLNGLQVHVEKINDSFLLSSNINLEDISPGCNFDSDWGCVLPIVLDYVHDLYISQARSTDIISSSEVVPIANQRIDLSIKRAIALENRLSVFEEFAFDEARPFGAAYNMGKITLRDALSIIDQSRKFRDWLQDIPYNADIIKEYHVALNRETILGKLPGTVSRFCFFTGGGLLLDAFASTGIATAAGLGLSTFDTFVLDRLLQGWRPDIFVEKVKSALNP